MHPTSTVLLAILLAVYTAGCASSPAEQQAQDTVDFVQPDPQTGSSAAVVVGGGALAHSELLLPVDADGSVRGSTTAEQIDRVLENIGTALAPTNATVADIVKIGVHVTSEDVLRAAKSHFAGVFSGDHKPAISYSIGELPHPDARVAADVVATAPLNNDRLAVRHADGLGDSEAVGHVAVAPLDQMLYVSGQAVRGDDLIADMHESIMAGLARLAYLGLSAEDIVQLKIFQADMNRVGEVREELQRYFIEKPAPPMVFSQWDRADGIEVEMIAAKPTTSDEGDAVTIRWSPDSPEIPQYSRLAEINYGDLVYLSSIHGDPSNDAAGQIDQIYARMGEVLDEAGSDFGHLLKATYYISDWQAPRLVLNDVRAEYYPAGRAPTSSLIKVASVGCEGDCLTAIDMIGVVPKND